MSNIEHGGGMKVACAWCNKVMKDGPDKPVSHGICAECAKELKAGAGGGK